MMTNRTFFNCSCTVEDLRTVNRYAERELISRCSAAAPLWEREEVFEKWLDEPFDAHKWELARVFGTNK